MFIKKVLVWLFGVLLFSAFLEPSEIEGNSVNIPSEFEESISLNGEPGKKLTENTVTKWAIVVAIGDYPSSSGWGKISADNDVPLIYKTLLSQGFKEENILLVSDSDATKQGIIDAINSHLIDNVAEGDVVFVHFSSHGQQIFDDNGDEIDGYDEAIVPYDANLRYVEGVYEGENHLRDDEIGELFNQVRMKLGGSGSMLTVVDACHSGTSTRGVAKARGTKTLMEPRAYVPKKVFDQSEYSFIGAQGAEEKQNVAPLVVISGASADQLNYETKDDDGNGVGSLTYTFSKVMADVENTLTYRELFDRIKIEMSRVAPNQTPQIEGDLDYEVFSGQVIKQEPYFVPQEWYDSEILQISAGSIHGFTNNSTVNIYDFSVQDFSNAEPIATGKVINSTAIESDIEINEDIDLRNESLKVVLNEQSYDGLMVSVQLALNRPDNELAMIKEDFLESGIIEIVDSGADLIIEDTSATSRGTMQVDLVTAQDLILYSGDLSTGDVDSGTEQLINEVKKYVKANFLRTLELNAADLNVELQLIPFDYTMRGRQINITNEYELQEFATPSGNIELKEGQAFKLKIINKGTKDAYFTIANFTPSGQAQLVVPYGNRQPADFIIEQGNEIVLSENLLQITPPYGTESLRLFATEEPLDLRPILDPINRGVRAGARGPFQMLLEDAATSTRSAPLGVPPAAANIHTVTFQVVPDNS